MDLDIFMLIRETLFMIIVIPLFYLSVDVLFRLKKGRVASSRIFLKGAILFKASRLLAFSSLFGLFGSATLFLWSLTSLEEFRILTGCSLIIFLALLLYFIYLLREILKG